MSWAMVHSRAVLGLQAPPVEVEVHLANGLPAFALVGLAETEVKEARERVRAALLSSGLPFPHNRRVTVSLAPADLPKDSGRFDLPIALGLLVAQGVLDAKRAQGLTCAGELSLAGELRPVRGALALALAVAHDAPGAELVLPQACAAEAARVPGLVVRQARHLAEVAAALAPDGEPLPRAQPAAVAPVAAGRYPDLADVRGQPAGRRALEVAAAGGHSLLLMGPPGTGKSMLAHRLPGLLPPLDEAAALQAAAVHSLRRSLEPAPAFGERPFRAPHHTASAAAMVGGGSPPRPGEISLAHGGVLFLDELPEFPRPALEALREPLENGHVTISRAALSARFPAAFQLVAAMNPCPCGWRGSQVQACRCTPDAVLRYQGRVSGPLLDRIDLLVETTPVPAADLVGPGVAEGSAAVASRVARARQRQQARQGVLNQALGPPALARYAALGRDAEAVLQRAAERLGWSARSLHRVLRVARTLADLADREAVCAADVAEALQYRRALATA